MSRFLRDIHDLESFREAVKQCKGDVYLLNQDKTEQFNLKSELSEFIALGRLADLHGSKYEIFCQFPSDEGYLLKYFYER